MVGRYQEDEIQTIKNYFGKDDKALKVLRKVFYQIPLSENEKELLQVLQKPEVIRVLRKQFLPEITGNEPINQVLDWWFTLKVRDFTPEQANCYLRARQNSIDYITQQLEVVEGKREQGAIDFNGLVDMTKSKEDAYVNFVSRNEIIEQIEGCLFQILLLAENKDAKEVLETLKRNSTK